MKRVRVVCIEDNEGDMMFLDLLYFEANRDSVERIHFRNVADATRYIEANEVDVCIVDLHLPDSTGNSGVTSLIGKYPMLPVVVISADRKEEDIKAALQSGAQDYLIKGEFTARALARVISHAQERGQFRRKLFEAEERLKRMNERVRAASSAKSTFLCSMSHEIRTPLNTIIGIADLLLDTKPSPEQTQYIEVFQRSGNHLLNLVNQVLDLAKIEAGEVSLQEETTHLGKLFSEVSEWANVTSNIKGLKFECTVGREVPECVSLDSSRLRQILINLLGNAFKFTEKGSVRLEASAQAGPFLTIRVVDTGIGIPAEKIESIFQEFSQADQSITRRYGGSGLGLAISKRLVERMHGQLSVTSYPGEGSVFEIRLPVKAVKQATEPVAAAVAAAADARAQIPREGAAASRRLLVAEDIADNRFLLQAYFRGKPYQVEFAENGEEALAKAKASPYDLVLMDLQMPVLDGLSATRGIREWETGAGRGRIPIIALTAHAFSEEVTKAINAGCDACLSKPIRRDHLLSKVDELISTGGAPL